MSRKLKNYGIIIEASLDLHGYTKDKAIRQLTLFLSNQARLSKLRKWKLSNDNDNNKNDCYYVEIITGSGSHSMDGPVLREAVRSVLDLREMKYIQLNAGSFAINVKSGYDLLPSALPTDTKISIVSRDSDIARVGMAGSRRGASSSISCTTSYKNQSFTSKNTNNDESDNADDFTPAEVKAFDDTLTRVKELSHNDFKSENQRKREEDKQLRKVLEQSKVDEIYRAIQIKQGEEEVQKAIEASKYDDFEVSLEAAIKASMVEEEASANKNFNEYEYNDIIEKVTQESILDSQSTKNKCFDDENPEYTRIIEEAIIESNRIKNTEMQSYSNDIQAAIKASLDALKYSNN